MKTLLGLGLLFIGGVMLLGHLHLGWLVPAFIGLILINRGWKRYHRSGRKLCGSFMILVGLFFMVGLIGKLLGIAFTLFLIYFGWRMVKDKQSSPTMDTTMAASAGGTIIIDPSPSKTYDAIDEWESRLNKKGKQ